LRAHDSPVPAQIVFGSLGSTRRAPIDCVCWSKIGLKLLPPSIVFQMPPDAEPT
jgi:hypothetical protein